MESSIPELILCEQVIKADFGRLILVLFSKAVKVLGIMSGLGVRVRVTIYSSKEVHGVTERVD